MTGKLKFIEEISRGNEALEKVKKVVFDKDTELEIYNDTDLFIKPVIRFEGIEEDGVVHARRLIIHVYRGVREKNDKRHCNRGNI